MDARFFAPAPVGNTGNHAISGQRVSNDWNIGTGMSQRGIAVSPDGSVAALGSTQHTDYSGPLWFFKHNANTVPWQAMRVPSFGGKPHSAGVRFDPAGNLYVGKLVTHQEKGVIYKFKPTGSLKSGCLFPTPPPGPAKVYSVNYGYRAPAFSRTPRFGVDGYGRIYYFKSLLSRVIVIDNEGNRILGFGTWGNRDSMGGLRGDLVPTKDIPMAFPNSVDATDDYIYVSDMVNLRLLRIKKTFQLD